MPPRRITPTWTSTSKSKCLRPGTTSAQPKRPPQYQAAGRPQIGSRVRSHQCLLGVLPQRGHQQASPSACDLEPPQRSPSVLHSIRRLGVLRSDRALDPTNASSAYYPNVDINKQVQVLATWNHLSAAQASSTVSGGWASSDRIAR